MKKITSTQEALLFSLLCFTKAIHMSCPPCFFTPHQAPRLYLSRSAVSHNLNLFHSRFSQVYPVIKANAYGLGLDFILPLLLDLGYRSFFIGTWQEAALAREIALSLGILEETVTFLILYPDPEIPPFFPNSLKPCFSTLESLQSFVTHPCFKKQPYALHLNTGINRYGIQLSELLSRTQLMQSLKEAPADLVLSHLACADDVHNIRNHQQSTRLHHEVIRLKAEGLIHPQALTSLGSSGAFYLDNLKDFDIVRPGHGCWLPPVTNQHLLRLQNADFKQAFRLTAPLIQVSEVAQGEFVGYGNHYWAPTPLLVGTLRIGHADGLPRLYQPGWCISLYGEALPVIGPVSMDLLTVDLSHFTQKEKLHLGLEFDIFNATQTLSDFAAQNHAIPLEFLVQLSQCTRRCLVT